MTVDKTAEQGCDVSRERDTRRREESAKKKEVRRGEGRPEGEERDQVAVKHVIACRTEPASSISRFPPLCFNCHFFLLSCLLVHLFFFFRSFGQSGVPADQGAGAVGIFVVVSGIGIGGVPLFSPCRSSSSLAL